MVNAHRVEMLFRCAQPVNPQAVAVRFELCPVIERIPPFLPVRAKIIRRHSGTFHKLHIPVKRKQLRICPNLSTVARKVYRHISDYSDAFFIGMLFQHAPLAIKFILQKRMIQNFISKLMLCSLHCGFFPEFQSVRPFVPCAPPEMLLQRAEKRIIVYASFVLHEAPYLVKQCAVRPRKSFSENLRAAFTQKVIQR